MIFLGVTMRITNSSDVLRVKVNEKNFHGFTTPPKIASRISKVNRFHLSVLAENEKVLWSTWLKRFSETKTLIQDLKEVVRDLTKSRF